MNEIDRRTRILALVGLYALLNEKDRRRYEKMMCVMFPEAFDEVEMEEEE